jgi:hypothetical protein
VRIEYAFGRQCTVSFITKCIFSGIASPLKQQIKLLNGNVAGIKRNDKRRNLNVKRHVLQKCRKITRSPVMCVKSDVSLSC